MVPWGDRDLPRPRRPTQEPSWRLENHLREDGGLGFVEQREAREVSRERVVERAERGVVARRGRDVRGRVAQIDAPRVDRLELLGSKRDNQESGGNFGGQASDEDIPF